MYITLLDGKYNELYDTETGKTTSVKFNDQTMRYHIAKRDIVSGNWTATEHIGTTDNDLIDKIMDLMYKRFGRIDKSNEWIKIRLSRKEFWPANKYRKIAGNDLRRIFGDMVKVTGTSLRYIYYISDDREIKHSPDNIGTKFGNPLIYAGYAVATIFKVGKHDVMSPGHNVAYWLTKPMWDGFHTRKRRVPKQFPGTTGFVATKWCQRTGYATYNSRSIDIAAMTQGKTLATWALNDLRSYWIERQGVDIFSTLGQRFTKEEIFSSSNDLDKVLTKKLILAKENAPFGVVGMMCPFCGKQFKYKPYDKCGYCGNKLYYGGDVSEKKKPYCVHCGLGNGKCQVAIEYMGQDDHSDQHAILHKIWNNYL